MIESTIKIVTAQYSNARAYANVVIVAGYAAFFAIWAAARDDIPVLATRWALLLMVFSATVFVLFEVVKMIWVSVIVLRETKALSAKDAETCGARVYNVGVAGTAGRTSGVGWEVDVPFRCCHFR